MRRIAVTAVWTILALSAPVVAAQETPEEPAPAVDPQAGQLVREMAETLAKLQQFELQVVDTIDDVLESGQKIQYTHVRSATVSRPGKLKVEIKGDVTNRCWWKDGKTITILDTANNVYGQVKDPGTIDEVIDLLSERYGVSTPLADLFSADVQDIMTNRVQGGEYLGLHLAGREECHHLAFTQENVDWQIWISAGEKTLPRKLLITYKQLPGQPQYTAMIERIVEIADLPDDTFVFKPPKGAEKVEIQPVETNDKPAVPQGE